MKLADAMTWPARHPRATLVIAVVLALLSALGISRIHADPSLERLFSQNDPAGKAIVRVLNNFSAAEELLVLASLPPGEPDTAKLLAFAQRLDDAVTNSNEAREMTDGIAYRIDPQMREFFEKVLAPAGMFYLDGAAFAAARQRLTREGIEVQIRKNEAMISVPGPAAQALSKALLQDPLHLHEFVLDRLAAQRPLKTFPGSDAFISQDGSSLLIRVAGKHPPSDLEFSKRFTSTIESLATRVNDDHLQLDISGGYAIAATSEKSIRHDMIIAVIGSVIFLGALFLLAYRRPVQFFAMCFVPVAIGVWCGFGAYSMIRTTLTPLTAVIGGILAGMGIDYPVHYLSQYQASRANAANPVEAVRSTASAIGLAIFAAWATSIIGFLAVGFASVPALHDFASMGTLGLSGAFLATIFLLPAIVVMFPSRESSMRLPVEAIVNLIALHRRSFVTASSIVIAIAIAVLLKLGPMIPLESDLRVMHPKPNPPLDAQQRITERMGLAADSMLIHLQADSPEKLVTLAHRVSERLNVPTVAGSYGLATLLPDPQIVDARCKAISAEEAKRIVEDFRAAIGNSIFDPKAYEPYEKFLTRLLTQSSPPTVGSLLQYPKLAETVMPRDAVEKRATPTEAMTLIFLRDSLSNRSARDSGIESIRAAITDLPGATLTGLTVIAYDTERVIARDLPRLVLAALVAVVIYLLVQFRSIKDSFLAMLPAIFGMTLLLAFARITGQKLNMINFVAVPLLIGIDTDYGIYLVTMARSKSKSRIAASCRSTIMCAASMTLGFGSLAFTSVPAVRSLGIAVGIGVIACLMGTLFLLLPLLIKPEME